MGGQWQVKFGIEEMTLVEGVEWRMCWESYVRPVYFFIDMHFTDNVLQEHMDENICIYFSHV